MAESKSSLSSSHHPSLVVCSECFCKIGFAYRGETPAHDPVTGDLKCSSCKLKKSASVMANIYPFHARGLEALPFFLLAEAQRVEAELERRGSHLVMYDKCINHVDENWVVVDMNELKCLCLTCSGKQPSPSALKGLLEASQIIRGRISTALTTPLRRKPILAGERKTQNDEGKGVVHDSRQAQMDLIQAVQCMVGAIATLNQWADQVKEANRTVHDTISRLRSTIRDETSCRRLEMTVNSIDTLFQQACDMHIRNLQPLLRIRQIISGTLLEGMRLLGLSVMLSDDGHHTYYVRDVVINLLSKRDVAPGCVGEEVAILRSIECLRETLENGDALLLELTGEDIEGILKQSGGMSEVLATVMSKGKGSNFDEAVGSCNVDSLLNEAKALKVSVMKAIATLSLVHEPGDWKEGALRWRERKEEQRTTVEACVKALLYDDLSLRPISLTTHKFIMEAKVKLGEANALFIEGVRQYKYWLPNSLFKYFSEAEAKGCEHPLLYYFIGQYYLTTNNGTPEDLDKAIEYYNKLRKVGSAWGHIGMHYCYVNSHRSPRGDKVKAFHYLLEMEREGFADGLVHANIGYSYSAPCEFKHDFIRAREYYQRAIDHGYHRVYVNLFDILWHRAAPRYYQIFAPSPQEEAMLTLIEADEKGIGVDDDQLLSRLVQCLRDRYHRFSARSLGHFKDRGAMSLYYCDVLTRRRSPLDYYWKSLLYKYGHSGLPRNESKAVALWEDADQDDLATFEMYYYLLIPAYKRGQGVAINGEKVLKYCERALILARGDDEVYDIYRNIAYVYARGLNPIPQDGVKALEFYEKALQKASTSKLKVKMYDRISAVYERGIPPLGRDLDKARQVYEARRALIARDPVDWDEGEEGEGEDDEYLEWHGY